jgi:hypothetical protein
VSCHHQANRQQECLKYLLLNRVERVGENALKGDSYLLLTAATIPPSPASVNTTPAADLATSVAVETAMPICAWRRRRRVVGPVAAHANAVPVLLERFDEIELSFR